MKQKDEIKSILKNYQNEIERIENLITNIYNYESEYMKNIQSESRVDKFKYSRISSLKDLTETYEKLVSSKNNILKEVYKIISDYSDDEEIKDYWIEISSTKRAG